LKACGAEVATGGGSLIGSARVSGYQGGVFPVGDASVAAQGREPTRPPGVTRHPGTNGWLSSWGTNASGGLVLTLLLAALALLAEFGWLQSGRGPARRLWTGPVPAWAILAPRWVC
jgi:hypothetical protein